MSERLIMPVLPLRGTVVFPGHATTLAIGRPASLRALEAATRGDRRLFAVAEREISEEPSAESLYTMGVVARLGSVQMGLSALQVVLNGEHRATAVDYVQGEYLRAVVVPIHEIPPVSPNAPSFVALHREARERALELGVQRGVTEDVLNRVVESVTDPGAFSDLVANYLELSAPEKQHLLETLGVEVRLRRVLIHVQRELELLKAQQQIKDQVAQELGGRQREIYLREQLKAIRRELGEVNEDRELEELRVKLAALELTAEARAEVDRELARLGHANAESMEAQVIRTYLQWISELPWNVRSEDSVDLERAADVLEQDHYGLSDVKDRVLEFLSVRVLGARQAEEEIELPTLPMSTPPTPSGQTEEGAVHEAKARALAKGPILLFIGPPGVGKTSIAQSIARALGRKYVRASLGGVRDEADIRGHRRTYVGAMPGRLIQGMRQAGTKNPVFLLDEVDKIAASIQGDPSAALLEVLDPAQNYGFTDHYLGLPFDLSEVLFIATGNFIHQIPGPLLDRMELVEFAGYTETEKAEIARRYLIQRQLAEAGLEAAAKSFSFSDQAVNLVIEAYTRESGVRQLERQIGAVTRKLARRLAAGEAVPRYVDAELVKQLLGRPRIRPEQAAAQDEVGVATGMYYTSAGGDIMFVEAAVRRRHAESGREPSNGEGLILTGQLGDVMKESARAALTYVTTHGPQFGISAERLGSIEAHVHVPAGAIPKDGPSAGVTIATALASALAGRAVRRDVAMTGEITLRGHVLPIGGVKEKVLGAHRAGVKEVILPLANEADLEDVPGEVRAALRFHLVPTLGEVLSIALVPEAEQAPSSASARGAGEP